MPPGRVRVIEHGIVLQDFSNVPDAESALAAFEEARAFMARRRADKSTRLITDLTDSNFNQKVVEGIKRLAEHHRPYVGASAIIGVSPIMRVIWRAVVALTGRDIRIFDNRDAAIAYLKEVSVPASAAAASPQTPEGPPGGRR